MLTFAIISDLHVGSGSRAADFWPSGTGTSLDSGYVQRFLNFVEKSNIRADFLLLPGDVAHRAQPDEFELGSRLLSQLGNSLGVSADRICFVPGNHDVDWSVMSQLPADPTGLRFTMRYVALRNPPWLFDRVMRRAHRHLLDDPPCFCAWDSGDVLVLGFNSSNHDTPDVSVHHGLVPQETIDEARVFLSSHDLRKHKVRISLVHHHPMQYSDPVPDEPDFSVMTNGGHFMELMRAFRFDLIVHGHKHAPQFTTQIINDGFPLVILGAGSFSARLDPRWSGLVNNQFHLITIGDRDVDGCVRGEVLSWTYLSGHGWVPSEPANGIRHRIPFGTHVQAAQLETRLEPLILECFRAGDYIEWHAIVSMIPELAHVAPATVCTVLDALASRLNFRRHGVPPDDVVLLRTGV